MSNSSFKSGFKGTFGALFALSLIGLLAWAGWVLCGEPSWTRASEFEKNQRQEIREVLGSETPVPEKIESENP